MTISDWRNHMAIQWFAFTHGEEDQPDAIRQELDMHTRHANDETTTDPTCGCEPLWPSGVDSSACWWHSGVDGLTDAQRLAGACGAIVGGSVGISGIGTTTLEDGR